MKLAKYTALALAVSLGTLTLAGCDDVEDPSATQADNADIDSQARLKVANDDAELKAELAKAQEKDPSIKDMYYTMDENGNKTLHIVRVEKDEQGNEQARDHSVGMAQGMLLGMIMGQLMSNPMGRGYNYMSYPPQSYPYSQYRQRKNTAVSSYVAGTRRSVARSYVSSRPSSAYAISSRSSGAFHSSGSARSGGYSAGG